MSLLGGGAVAIWHDLAPEGRDEFYAWHGKEHMPERVGIPGFMRGRRYVALRADLEYFNLYEAASPEVVSGPDYQQRLNDPSPWTRSMIKHSGRLARSVCKVAATFGTGQGGLVATCCYDVSAERSAAHVDLLSRKILPEIADRGSVAGAHLLVADLEASAVGTAEQKLRSEADRVPRWIMIVEGWGDQAPFSELCRCSLSDEVLASSGAIGPAEVGLYRLQATMSRSDVDVG